VRCSTRRIPNSTPCASDDPVQLFATIGRWWRSRLSTSARYTRRFQANSELTKYQDRDSRSRIHRHLDRKRMTARQNGSRRDGRCSRTQRRPLRHWQSLGKSVRIVKDAELTNAALPDTAITNTTKASFSGKWTSRFSPVIPFST
jgi:hypothetical protein